MNKEDFIKMDSYMALSILNMKLRDEFSSLEDYCSYMDITMADIEKKMKEAGYFYDRNMNQFIAI